MSKIYAQELQELQKAKEIIEQNYKDISEEKLKEAYQHLTDNFEEAIGQLKLITNVSDKVQKRLDKLNNSLDQKNQELERTVQELSEAKAGKIATTIVMFLAALLFVVEEIVLEPIIYNFVTANQWYSLGIKLVLVLLLKPLEIVLENIILKYLYQKRQKTTTTTLG
ncbi:MAG: hypothetical protein SFU27_04330 [Thermonemataceae bacterium]|nr:hypothetical protein [Thermonemataceae bacterium]